MQVTYLPLEWRESSRSDTCQLIPFPVHLLTTCSSPTSSLLPPVGCGSNGKKTKAHSWGSSSQTATDRRQVGNTGP